jgi:glycosyltransferase involved in cell wall biosynthesis
MKISAVICTHNPRPHYLQRVLGALEAQTLPKSEWEVLLVDNASTKPLVCDQRSEVGDPGGEDRNQRTEIGGRGAGDRDQGSEVGEQRSEGGGHEAFDLSWHPQARLIREEKVGLTHARLRGIAEARGELIVFIDDDNLLAPDYLERCVGIAGAWPQLGVWGGSVAGEFEVTPPDWIKRFLPGMVVYEIDRDYWSNMAVWSSAIPFGAGMCIRNSLARIYADAVQNDPLRQKLDRTGSSASSSSGDVDLAFTVIDQGFGAARFQDLKITHLIPKERLTEDYVVRLFSGFEVSGAAFAKARGEKRLPFYGDLRSELRFWKKYLESSPIDRKIQLAARRQMKEMKA